MKCNCPLCKALVNKRDYHEAPKLANITTLFKTMLDSALVVETYDRKVRINSEAINGYQAKKRKFFENSSDNEGTLLLFHLF